MTVRVIAMFSNCKYRSLSKICPPPKICPLPIFAASYCKGSFITQKYTHPTNQNNIYVASSMHNDEICSVCVGLLYLVLCLHDNKQTHSSSSGWSGHNRGTAAEADAVGEQQLERTQLGCSSVWPCKTSACQRNYHTRRVRVRGCARLTQLSRERVRLGAYSKRA